MENILLYTKLTALPEKMKLEVSNFIDFLIAKAKIKQEKNKAVFGSAKGMFTIHEGFDEPLDDFKEYMH